MWSFFTAGPRHFRSHPSCCNFCLPAILAPRLPCFLRKLLPLQHDRQAHQAQHDRLQPRVLAEQDRHVADPRDEAEDAADDVLFAVQEGLAACVELRVVGDVVVAFGEQTEGVWSARVLAHASVLLLGLAQEESPSNVAGNQKTHPPPNLLTTRCTIGMSLPRTLYTTTSPILVSMARFHKKSKSPRWKAGSMLPDSTTTIGDGELVATDSPFQSMKAVLRTSAKLRICAAICRGWSEPRGPSRSLSMAARVCLAVLQLIEAFGARSETLEREFDGMRGRRVL